MKLSSETNANTRSRHGYETVVSVLINENYYLIQLSSSSELALMVLELCTMIALQLISSPSPRLHPVTAAHMHALVELITERKIAQDLETCLDCASLLRLYTVAKLMKYIFGNRK